MVQVIVEVNYMQCQNMQQFKTYCGDISPLILKLVRWTMSPLIPRAIQFKVSVA